MEHLFTLDQQFFEAINSGMSNSFFDQIMPILRNKKTWFPLYAVIALFLFYKYRWQGLIIAIFAGLCIVATDQISSSIIKPAFHRLRPCNDQSLFQEINVLIRCGSGYSFTSSHATNHFGFALFFGTIFIHKNRWVLYIGLIWAALVSFAQIYVGVHYPLDILTGALTGMLIGFAVGVVARIALQKVTWNENPAHRLIS